MDPLAEPLTRREREVLVLLADLNLKNEDIALQLFLSIHAVKWHVRQIYAKLGVSNRREALDAARTHGILGKPSVEIPIEDPHFPVELTSFVGREAEIDEILGLLAESGNRLITIAGAGGSGKTRLALKVIERLMASKTSGPQKIDMVLVELAEISDGASVSEIVARALGIRGSQGPMRADGLVAALRERSALLVLDNCEHLVEACAQLVVTLLKNCPRLRFLTTSREILELPGEIVYWLSPMKVPNSLTDLKLEQAREFEGVCLFVERAKTAMSGFSLLADNFGSIAKISSLLDGLPLAIELAAARVRMMDVAQIAERIEASIQTLAANNRGAPPRQKTIIASIEWSFNLLSEMEQRLLVRLSVFGWEWTLESAEEVCSEEGLLPHEHILQLVCDLVDKSLVTRVPLAGTKIHFRLLKPILQFSRERLEKSGELFWMRRRLLTYLLGLSLDDLDIDRLMEVLNDIHFDWDYEIFECERWLRLGLRLAERAGIEGENLRNFRRGALLCDIGKSLIPNEIMLKTTALTEDEWAVMHLHPYESVRLLQSIPGFENALDIAMNHHECWDGSGYPRHLKGEEIPLAARIISITQNWVALVSDRPWRRAFSRNMARSFMLSDGGKALDPQLVSLFIEQIDKDPG